MRASQYWSPCASCCRKASEFPTTACGAINKPGRAVASDDFDRLQFRRRDARLVCAKFPVTRPLRRFLNGIPSPFPPLDSARNKVEAEDGCISNAE